MESRTASAQKFSLSKVIASAVSARFNPSEVLKLSMDNGFRGFGRKPSGVAAAKRAAAKRRNASH